VKDNCALFASIPLYAAARLYSVAMIETDTSFHRTYFLQPKIE